MASRTQKLHRLFDVLHALETVERAKVGELTREIDQVHAAQQEILQSLAEPTPLHGRFIALLSRRVSTLEKRLTGLSRERELALTKYTDAMAKEHAASAMLLKSRVTDARSAEQKSLEELLQFFDAGAQGRGKSKPSM